MLTSPRGEDEGELVTVPYWLVAEMGREPFWAMMGQIAETAARDTNRQLGWFFDASRDAYLLCRLAC